MFTYDAFLLAIAWIAYFIIHSVLASLTVKHWVSQHLPSFMPSYRISFNFIAIVLLSLPFYISATGQSMPLWKFTGVSEVIAHGISLLAIVGFVWSLKFYDMREFSGIRQLVEQEKHVEDQEHLQISPMHRFVRHPWYTFALMIIWSRPMNSLVLASSILLSAYFIFGSRLEEKKLVQYYGEVYKQYQRKVPRLLPLPWRYLSAKDANILLELNK